MESLMKYISRTSRCANLFRGDKVEGLGGYQHIYILKICKHPGISQEQLAQMIYINKSNVTRQLSMLEQNGYITRKPCEKDRRIMEVYPTKKALEIYPQVQRISKDWNNGLIAEFSEEEQALLLSMMERVMNRAIARLEQDAKERSEKEWEKSSNI